MRSILPILAVLIVAVQLVLSAGCGGPIDGSTHRLLEEAQKASASAKAPDDYLMAAGLYQQVLDRGVVSGAVFYNQGNAFFHAGQRGRAIAAYRRAQCYRPRDPYLEANLAGALAADAAGRQGSVPLEAVLFWRGWLSELELFRAAVVAAGVALAFGSVRLWLRARIWGWVAVAGLIAACWFSISAGHRWYRHEHLSGGVVVRLETVARQGPGRSYEAATAKPLQDGTEFRLLEHRANWLHVRLADGQDVWVERNHTLGY